MHATRLGTTRTAFATRASRQRWVAYRKVDALPLAKVAGLVCRLASDSPLGPLGTWLDTQRVCETLLAAPSTSWRCGGGSTSG